MQKMNKDLKFKIKNLKKGIKLEGTKLEDAINLVYDKAIDDVIRTIEEWEEDKSEDD